MRSYLLLVFLIVSFAATAQLETSNWFLNANRISVKPSGITTGLPTPSIYFYGGTRSTSISDPAGNLLFAFNGQKIYDKNLAVMPALTNVNLQSTGKKLIQQIPNSSRYYIFYTTPNSFAANSPWTLRYAIVDLTLNAGNGDVISYDQVIDPNSSPSFTLSQNGELSSAWLVTHRCATDSFFTYKIDASGLSNTPVKTKVGTIASVDNYIFWDLKTSFDGKTIAGIAYKNYSSAFATTYRFIEVYKINEQSGVLNQYVRTIRMYGYFFSFLSLEYSPDNKLLYLGEATRVDGLQPCGYGGGTLHQYNLCYTDSLEFTRYHSTIATDFNFCYPFVSWGNIQMGADKRIHIPYTGTSISTINNPNRIGSYSNYRFDSYQVSNPNYGSLTTPDFNHRMMEKPVKNNIAYEGNCHPNPVSFRITNDTIASVHWNFGDPASADNLSSLLTPSHVFTAPGLYTVTAVLYNSQNVLIETVTELIEIKDPDKRLLYEYPTDTTFCEGGSLNLKLKVVNGLFHWYRIFDDGAIYNSTISDSLRITSSGTWYVEMRQNDCNGCRKLDSIHVTVLPKPRFNLGTDRNLCYGDSVLLSVYDPNANFIWSTGSIASSIYVKQGGLYWAQAEYSNNGCPFRDSIVITEVPGVNFSLPADTVLCNNQTLLLNPGVASATYLWQNGSTQPTFSVTQPGTYWVRITNSNSCFKRDTIEVSYVNAEQVYLGRDTTLCIGSSLQLRANVLNAQYLWNTGAVTDRINITQSGSYWVKVNNGSCIISDTINVEFRNPPIFNLGNDTTLCANERLILNPGISNAVYSWQDGSHTNTFNVSHAGTYWLEINQYSCVVKDTIVINYYSVPAISLGPDLKFCLNDSATLNAGPGFNQYIWSNGYSGQSFVVHNQGNYSVIGITANGCKAYDTLLVQLPYSLPVSQLNPKPDLCAGTTVTLNAGQGFASYLWNSGNTGQFQVANSTGTYSVIITDNNGCKNKAVAVIDQLLPSPSGFLPTDTAICSYGNITLKPANTFKDYLWNNGSRASSLFITTAGQYTLQVTNSFDCIGKDTVVVKPKECMIGFYAPSAFTPNGDGRNDEFKPLLFGNIKSYKLTVFNRWGEIVFQSSSPGSGWNGRYHGLPQDSNVFIWSCSYQLEGSDPKLEKGTIVLVR